MKIAITGTRGIPNRYGGFEQFAEQLSSRLAQRGHDVWVYNPSFHPVINDEYNKVKIIRKSSPEKYFGPASNYLYDFLCLRDAVKREADIILECGYATATPAIRVLNFKKTLLLINPDGMEWQRPRWNLFTRKIIQISEKTAVKLAHRLICDNPEIISYYKEKYSIDPIYIPYGSDIFKNPDEQVLKMFNIQPFEYFLLISRFEPANNLGMIIQGFLNSGCEKKLLVIGDPLNDLGRKLIKKFGALANIFFAKNIFDQNILDNLRYYSQAYFHGHSSGGTNPSLLEAMAAGSLIISHDNKFNRYILRENALYFKDENDIIQILHSEKDWMSRKKSLIEENRKRIEENYQWEDVTNQYENLFKLQVANDLLKKINDLNR
jgi:glycosyltransferase involved in cell wall biosynthesis